MIIDYHYSNIILTQRTNRHNLMFSKLITIINSL